MTFQSMSSRITDLLVERSVIERERADVHAFGMEILLSTLANGVLVLAIAILTRTLPGTIALLIPFMAIRSKAGGYHADSHAGCILLFLAVYGACLVLIRTCPTVSTAFFEIPVMLAACGVIIAIGAIRHANRPVTDAEYARYRITARLLSAILTAVGVVAALVLPKLCAYFALGMAIAANSLVVAWIQERRKGGHQDDDV